MYLQCVTKSVFLIPFLNSLIAAAHGLYVNIDSEIMLFYSRWVTKYEQLMIANLDTKKDFVLNDDKLK